MVIVLFISPKSLSPNSKYNLMPLNNLKLVGLSLFPIAIAKNRFMK